MTSAPFVDPELCVGSGTCEFLAPHTFELDDEGISHSHETVGDELDAVQQAVESCPARAIRWDRPGGAS
jgi:ferredoxin